ncbi:MAG: hypothetical protein KIS96_10995 [Bauldia sp.]|nr:hypothetical protein [Bauldia sp.]
MSTTLPPNVRVGIVDRTSMAGMTPEALAMLDAAAATAAAIGVTLTVTAAAGGGHLSHAGGTEFDIVGVNADGSPWTPDQRAAIARGAASGGADRFGLYSDADGIWRGNALHIGMSGDGRPSAVWGHGDLTGGAASRAFTEPSELVFLQDFYAGDLLAEDPAAGLAPAANAAAGGLRGGDWRDRETPIRDAIAANRGRNRLHIFRQVLDAMRAEGVENPFRAALQFMRANRPPTIRDAIRQRFGGAGAARYEPVALG